MDAANTRLRNALDQAQDIRADRIQQAERVIADRQRDLDDAKQHKDWWTKAGPLEVADQIREEQRRHKSREEAKADAEYRAREEQEGYASHLQEKITARICTALMIAGVLISVAATFFLPAREAGLISGVMLACLTIALIAGRTA